ncbi:DinB family protein [Marinomonas fungiae]|uniref:DinB family protein n=1 Tax=Marinomonas fungiae TaxID=1137284 RepID=UPI003A951F0F
MNKKIYYAVRSLSDAERKKDRGAFFKSIHGTLNHILLADKLWLGRMTGESFALTGLDQELHSDFAALEQDRIATDAAITAYVAGLTEERLACTLRYTSVVNPEPREFELWFAVAHFFNHQTHHRGQVTTLLSQLGVDVGITDMVFMPRELA